MGNQVKYSTIHVKYYNAVKPAHNGARSHTKVATRSSWQIWATSLKTFVY